MLDGLHTRGIRELIMMTGDDVPAARAAAGRLGFDRFQAEVLPEEKAEFVSEWRAEGRTVAMIGDWSQRRGGTGPSDVGIAVLASLNALRGGLH